MVVSDEAPTKKRRVEEERNAIREASGNLQYLGGYRQNRWMMDVDPPQDVQTANALAHAENARRTQKPVVVTIDLDEEEEGANVAGATARSPSQPGGIQSRPQLVNYQSGLSTFQITSMTKSMEAVRTQPSLPSPAPSDENINSPTFAENQIAALRNRGVQRLSTDMSTAAMSGPGSPMAMQSPVQVQLPQQRQQQQHLPRNISIPQHVGVPQPVLSPQFQYPQLPLQNLPQVQMPHQRQASHHQRRAMQGNAQRTGQPLQSPPIVPSNQPLPQQGQPHQPSYHASRIPKQVLHDRINAMEQAMQPRLTATDNGRLTLLRFAVEKEDWFYQVLSQLFCMRTVMPTLLPKSLKDLPVASWEQLGGLLVPNTEVNNELLMFFSEFPEPIMDLYSDPHNAREIYEARVQAVRTFLLALPQHWEGITQSCRQNLAPPLVEDMITILHLHSMVLQNTCFRAIARMFWGTEESPGMKILEGLHELDQQTCMVGKWRRTPSEKHHAYAALRAVYEHWDAYRKRQQQRTSFSPTAQPFAVPPEIHALFGTMPRSMMPSIPQQMPSLQMPPQQIQDHWQPPSSAQQVQQIQQNQRRLQASQAAGGRPQNRGSIPQSPTVLMPGGPHMQQLPPAARQGLAPATHAAQNNLPGQPPLKKRLAFPTPAEIPRPQPTHPEPSRSGLHQAHLRSPNLMPADPKQDAPRLYRYVTGFAMLPVNVKKRIPVQVVDFELLDDAFNKVAKTIAAATGSGLPRTRVVSADSLMYRLRCCAVPATGFTSESSWIVADNSWPEELSFELNGQQLHTRRKLHHGRYLPIDVTSHVIRGTNTLKIYLNRSPHDKRRFDYALAVETIGVMSHDTIKNGLGRVTAEGSLAAIKKALSGESDNNDDDIAVTSSNMTISIVEPLSQARLVDVPVRGANCLHKDVFDLEVFLSVCKRERPEWPTVVDCWRCPLCRGDIRPQTLIVDEFLVHVRAELEKRNLTDTKAIVIEADGTWKPKKEERTGVRSPSLEREDGGRSTSAATPSAPTKVVEVIELD